MGLATPAWVAPGRTTTPLRCPMRRVSPSSSTTARACSSASSEFAALRRRGRQARDRQAYGRLRGALEGL